MTHATVDGDDGRFAGCCAIPNPRRGAPHVAHWAGESEGVCRFLPVKLSPDAAIRLGKALIEAGEEVQPNRLEHAVGEIPRTRMGGPDED